MRCIKAISVGGLVRSTNDFVFERFHVSYQQDT
jgi:hypothetical protein